MRSRSDGSTSVARKASTTSSATVPEVSRSPSASTLASFQRRPAGGLRALQTARCTPALFAPPSTRRCRSSSTTPRSARPPATASPPPDPRRPRVPVAAVEHLVAGLGEPGLHAVGERRPLVGPECDPHLQILRRSWSPRRPLSTQERVGTASRWRSGRAGRCPGGELGDHGGGGRLDALHACTPSSRRRRRRVRRGAPRAVGRDRPGRQHRLRRLPACGSTSVSTGWRGWRCSASKLGIVVRFEMARWTTSSIATVRPDVSITKAPAGSATRNDDQ